MATEIAILPLREGKRPDDANSVTGQALKDVLNTLTEQDGFQRAYWGIEVENPNVLRLFVDWDSVDAHINFTKNEYEPPHSD
jgi:heme-degrading monooxygenase HmoA